MSIRFDEARAEMRSILRELDTTESPKRRRDLRRHYRKLEKEYKEARAHWREANRKREDTK